MDKYAEIGKRKLNGRTNQLVEHTPINCGDKEIWLQENGELAPISHSPKISTNRELQEELKRQREKYAPFLCNKAPAVQSSRERFPIVEFTWNLEGEVPREVTIPHYGGPLGPAVAYYNSDFVMERLDGRIFFVCKGADYKAKVYINDQFVGSHEGFFAPFEFDISQYVVLGNNHLTIRLENDYIMGGNQTETDETVYCGDKLYAATGLGYDDAEFGWHHCPPGMGIYNDVYIERRSPLYIEDVFVRAPSGETEVWVEVCNTSYIPEDFYLNLSVYGQNFEETVVENMECVLTVKREIGVGDTYSEVMSQQSGEADKPILLQAEKGRNLFKIPLQIENAKRWSPDHPYLYQVQVRLRTEEQGETDVFCRQFGVRSFTQDVRSSPKGMFYLNGEKIKLRGANTMGFEQQCVMKKDFSRLIDDILLAKICNMNFWRITQRPVQDEVYEYCDQLGLMTQVDLPLFGVMRRQSFCEGLRQAEEMERMLRAHPCNVVITYINEPFPNANNKPHINLEREELEAFFSAADNVVRLNNPDRVIKHIDGDYDPPDYTMPDNHCYPMWYNGHGIDIGKLHKGYWLPIMPDWYCGCGEFGSEGLEDKRTMLKYYPKAWLPDQEGNWSPGQIVMAQTEQFHPFFYETQNTMEDWIRESQRYQAFATRFMTEAYRRNPWMVSFAIHLFIDAFPSGWMKAIMDCDRNPKPAYFEYKNALEPCLISLRSDRDKYFDSEELAVECYLCNDTNDVYDGTTLRYELSREGRCTAVAEDIADIKQCAVTGNGVVRFSLPNVKEREAFCLKALLVKGENVITYNTFLFEVFPSVARVQITMAEEPLEQNLKERDVIFVYLSDLGEQKQYGQTVKVCQGAMAPVHFLSRNTKYQGMEKFTPYDFRLWYDKAEDRIVPLADKVFYGEGFTPILTSPGFENGQWKEMMAVGERKIGNCRLIFSTVDYDLMQQNPIGRNFLTMLLKNESDNGK